VALGSTSKSIVRQYDACSSDQDSPLPIAHPKIQPVLLSLMSDRDVDILTNKKLKVLASFRDGIVCGKRRADADGFDNFSRKFSELGLFNYTKKIATNFG